MTAPISRSASVFAGVAAAVALGPACHLLVRGLMEARTPPFDPRAFVWTERSLFLEQLGITAFLVVVLASFAAPWLARRPALAPRVVSACVWVGALCGVLGGALRR